MCLQGTQAAKAYRGRADKQLQDAQLLCSSHASFSHQCSQQHTCELHRNPGVVLLCPGDVAPESGCIQKLPAVFPGRRPAGLVHGQHVLAQRPVLQPGGSRSGSHVRSCGLVRAAQRALCSHCTGSCSLSQVRLHGPVRAAQELHSELCACTALSPAARIARFGLSACACRAQQDCQRHTGIRSHAAYCAAHTGT